MTHITLLNVIGGTVMESDFPFHSIPTFDDGKELYNLMGKL